MLRLALLLFIGLTTTAPVWAEGSASGVTVSVTLEQGAVDVKGHSGKLALYREKKVATPPQEMSFEDMKREMEDGVQKQKDDFQKYKEEVRREFVAYVESVTMKPGTELTISGDQATERKASGKPNAARDFMKRWKAEDDARQ